MVEIFVQPLVGALCLIVFHIQAVMDSPDNCAWQLGFQVVSSQNSSQLPAASKTFFDLLGTHICMPLLYYHCNVKDGAPIIGPDHPVMLEMFEQPITGAL